MITTYKVTVEGEEVNIFDTPDEARDFAVAIKNGEIPEYSGDDIVECESDNGMEEIEKRFTILLQAGDYEYIWDGYNFDSRDSSVTYRRDYSYSDDELPLELEKAKKYADEKYESGEWVVNSEDVYSQTEIF